MSTKENSSVMFTSSQLLVQFTSNFITLVFKITRPFVKVVFACVRDDLKRISAIKTNIESYGLLGFFICIYTLKTPIKPSACRLAKQELIYFIY